MLFATLEEVDWGFSASYQRQQRDMMWIKHFSKTVTYSCFVAATTLDHSLTLSSSYENELLANSAYNSWFTQDT